MKNWLLIPSAVYDILFNFAQSDGFWANWQTAFGTSYDVIKTTELRQQWQSRNFSQLPSIEVLSGEILRTANGAYSSSKNKIYLSASFLNTASSAAIVNVILEEIGHYVDAQINQTDSAGDEGAIFAALVQGEVLSPSVLAELKTEDDGGWLEVNGQNLEVEYNNPTVSLSLTSPSTVTEDGPQNLFYVFSRTGDTTNSLTVNFNVSGSATFNNDYVQRGASSFGTTTGSVTFAAGSRVFILSLDPSSDVVSDGNETVALTLAAGTGYEVGSSAVTGTILDNDVVPGTVVRGSIAKSRNDKTRHEVGNDTAFAALKSDGSVVTWGADWAGGNSSSVSSSLTSGVTQIFSNSWAFAALKSDGSVVTWGNFTVSSSLTSGVTQIFSNDLAFAALKSDGSVVTWGYSSHGGNSSSVSSQLTSGVVSFADPFNDDRLVPSSTPFITLAVSPTSVTEDGTSNLIYTFSRTGSTTSPLTVNYTIGGTATNGSDYGTIGTSVTFAAGSSTATVTVDPTADTTPEDNETVSLTLASGTGYNIGTTAAVTGTIFDDDTIVTLAVAPTSVTEDGTTNLVYTFTRNGFTSNALTVNYTIGGTAINGNDYSSIGSSVTFAAGSSTATVTVDPTSDTTGEADETVTLTLAS
ncbi:MAG: Calx-beta domain-containing protein, partial [Dolichospermum sp.]